jgi:hypothetical protein
VNPDIVERSEDDVVDEEGCLSIPGLVVRTATPAANRGVWIGHQRPTSVDQGERTGSRTLTLAAVRSYQQAIRSFAAMSNLDVWYSRLDVNGVIQGWGAGVGAKR